MTKFIALALLTLLAVGCETVETKRPELNSNTRPTQIPTALRPNENTPVISNEIPMTTPSSITGAPEQQGNNMIAAPPKLENGDRPKVGLLLGPGGVRAFAHIGVLQELLKAKIPIVSVVGFETGALVGGIYSAKGQTYDVEWQMGKLHEEDFIKKSIMTSEKPQDIRQLSSFLQNAVGSIKAEDAKVNFACPSYNLVKRQVFMMSRGPLSAMLPYCVPFIPFYKPYQQSIAALTSLAAAIRFLKSKGVNYLIYVDLLGEKSIPFFADNESEENIEWATVAEALEPQLGGVNKVISVSLNGLYINDFAHRRDMSQRGQEAGKAAAREITNELGL